MSEQNVDIAQLRNLVSMLAIGRIGTWDEELGGIDHALLHEEDGDGWHEPRCEDWTCECEGWEGVSWVQTDPACSGIPDPVEVAIAWHKHVNAAFSTPSKPTIHTWTPEDPCGCGSPADCPATPPSSVPPDDTCEWCDEADGRHLAGCRLGLGLGESLLPHEHPTP